MLDFEKTTSDILTHSLASHFAMKSRDNTEKVKIIY